MRIRFVGGGDTFGSGGRWQTCIHLSCSGQAVLVDCGATSLAALKAQGLDARRTVLTHMSTACSPGSPTLTCPPLTTEWSWICDRRRSLSASPLIVAWAFMM
jgi:hypothetical protein